MKQEMYLGISESEFYGDLVYRFRKIMWENLTFFEQFKKLINRYIRIGCGLNIMQPTVCLVIKLIIGEGYASVFNYTTAVRASDNDSLFQNFNRWDGLDDTSFDWPAVIQPLVFIYTGAELS